MSLQVPSSIGKQRCALHYTLLHYIITLHYVTLHYITLHYITCKYRRAIRIERRVIRGGKVVLIGTALTGSCTLILDLVCS
jgi:hypothetical protein